MTRTLARLGLVLVLVGLVAGGLYVFTGPGLMERQVQHAIFTAIDREVPESFLITGRLEVSVTTRIEDSRVLLPGIVGLDLGTARATVRVPGRVSYGFATDSLRPAMVRLASDGVIEMELPTLEVYSAEPDLAAMEVETERGWARLPGTRDEVERQAVAVIEGALRRQGTAHLRSSYQPRINAARALQRILSPALQGLGMDNPSFRFHIGDDLVVQPTG